MKARRSEHLFPTNFGQSACNSVKVQPISTLRLPNHSRPAAELLNRRNCLHYFRNACTKLAGKRWRHAGVVNARRIILHCDETKLLWRIDALFQFNCAIYRTDEIGCTPSRMRALLPKLGGGRCISCFVRTWLPMSHQTPRANKHSRTLIPSVFPKSNTDCERWRRRRFSRKH